MEKECRLFSEMAIKKNSDSLCVPRWLLQKLLLIAIGNASRVVGGKTLLMGPVMATNLSKTCFFSFVFWGFFGLYFWFLVFFFFFLRYAYMSLLLACALTHLDTCGRSTHAHTTTNIIILSLSLSLSLYLSIYLLHTYTHTHTDKYTHLCIQRYTLTHASPFRWGPNTHWLNPLLLRCNTTHKCEGSGYNTKLHPELRLRIFSSG